MKKILIVEDDRRIAQNILRGLVSENFDAEIAHDGITGKQMALDKKFDLIFADAWPGKYETLIETLNLLKVGGFYIIDDMLHQPNWPDGHIHNVEQLIAQLEQIPTLSLTKMNWSTGIVIVTKLDLTYARN